MSADGRVEVAGRWYGVRGRRFVRPALTLVHKGQAVRALAELEHKPWAAQDGEVWIAAFTLGSGLDGAREIELSVAPDITVTLRPKGRRLARPGAMLAAGVAARSSRLRQQSPPVAEPAGDPPQVESPPGPPRRRRPAPDLELERVGARLATAEHALEQERALRADLARALEEERTSSRQLRTELGQARSELEVAAAARAQAAAVEAELDDARRQLREAQRRHEQETQALRREHEEAALTVSRRHEQATEALTRRQDEASRVQAALQHELAETAAALQSAREALAAERAETERLRDRLARGEETPERTASSPAATASARPTGAVAPGAAAAGGPRVSRRPAGSARAAEPQPTQRYEVPGIEEGLTSPSAAASRSAARRASGQHGSEAPTWAPPPAAERLRPVNPSLRHSTWWFGRLLALLVLVGVIAAVWLVLHSTVLH